MNSQAFTTKEERDHENEGTGLRHKVREEALTIYENPLVLIWISETSQQEK